LDIRDALPVRKFAIDGLADVIVLAGPNGVGKTRLVQTILNAFRTPSKSARITLAVQATCEQEQTEWGVKQLDTSDPKNAALLARTIQRNQRRTHWQSSVFQFESDRTNPTYQHFGFSWDAMDPWDEVVDWDSALSGLRNRYQDTIASIFRKVHSQNDAIAKRGRELIKNGGGHIDPSDFPDPLKRFKEAFGELLAPKKLLDPDPRDQSLYFEYEGQRFPVSVLSSGEREVVNIVFDFLLHDPSDSIVVFDEPELHLHPELSYKLLHALRNAGARNQFIFVTHSPDIITASLEHSVVFVAPAKPDGSNQAVPVKEDDATNEALRLIGQSVGIVSLGKRIVLIEGGQTSLDKQTYGAILKNRFPGLVLVPSGGKGLIQSFHSIADDVLSRALWGVEFFMLCDRDALPASSEATAVEAKGAGRLRVLKRYHLENYFLEERVLARLFEGWENDHSWLHDEGKVLHRLQEIARSMVPYGTALIVAAKQRERFGNLDLMVKSCHGKSVDELATLVLDRNNVESGRFAKASDANELETLVRETHTSLSASVEDGSWKVVLPGKPILEQFARAAGVTSGRLKTRYLAEVEKVSPYVFDDVVEIFAGFAAM
jgi:energy-coupling factor transporter ATP-binding protein EcfA2